MQKMVKKITWIIFPEIILSQITQIILVNKKKIPDDINKFITNIQLPDHPSVLLPVLAREPEHLLPHGHPRGQTVSELHLATNPALSVGSTSSATA